MFVARRGEDICGSLCFAEKTVDGSGTVINALPWYGSHGGPWIADPDDAETRTALLAGFQAYIRKRRPLFWTLVSWVDEQPYLEIYRRILEASAEDSRIGQMTELPPASAQLPEHLMRVCKQKTRNLVRKSQKQGFSEYVSDDDFSWNALHRLHTENMTAIGGKAKPESHFQAMRRHIPASMRRLSLAMRDGEVAAAMLLLRHNDVVEYITPAIDLRFRAQQPLSFLIWHGMIDMIKFECRQWNWGGTWASQTTLHHFKAGWGATDHPYTYFIGASKPGLDLLRDQPERLIRDFEHFYLFPFSRIQHPLDPA